MVNIKFGKQSISILRIKKKKYKYIYLMTKQLILFLIMEFPALIAKAFKISLSYTTEQNLSNLIVQPFVDYFLRIHFKKNFSE